MTVFPKAVLGVDVTQCAINTVGECASLLLFLYTLLFFTFGHLWALVAYRT